ncbi:Uncharacterized protein SCF082_LOCUS3913 [Durusdinium trenchii]|uniref:Shugoshin C-terminal domain-containing protein n=1 Tax=Durusdinium trenchii TaxID=1381693 RepID=A0ABP0HXM1_9DINO
MAWAQRTEKARAVPETRYDQQLLNDTILSIKASFRHLEQSCTALERKVSKSRTRIVSQMMHLRKPERHSAKPDLPRMPWSEPRVDSRPVARVYAAAAAAAASAKAAEQMERETELQTSTMSDSDLSDESSMSSLDWEALATLETLEDAYLPEAAEMLSEAPSSSRPSPLRSGSSRPESVTSRTSGVKSSRSRAAAIAARINSMDIVSPSVSIIGNTAGLALAAAAASAAAAGSECAPSPARQISADIPWVRPHSQVRLRVQANRPFSAPRMRYERARDERRPDPKEEVKKPPRPSTAVVGGKIRRDGQKGGTVMPPSRPIAKAQRKSAFAPRRHGR